ncbi:MAG TPA: hypothetical protein VES02_06840 [Dermatophilaceae bacterium]|nr:hypothetical protein [Dermatophilaceae bacterium]
MRSSGNGDYALALQAMATLVAVFVPVVAVLVFLAVSVLLFFEPLWRARRRRLHGPGGKPTGWPSNVVRKGERQGLGHRLP